MGSVKGLLMLNKKQDVVTFAVNGLILLVITLVRKHIKIKRFNYKLVSHNKLYQNWNFFYFSDRPLKNKNKQDQDIHFSMNYISASSKPSKTVFNVGHFVHDIQSLYMYKYVYIYYISYVVRLVYLI